MNINYEQPKNLSLKINLNKFFTSDEIKTLRSTIPKIIPLVSSQIQSNPINKCVQKKLDVNKNLYINSQKFAEFLLEKIKNHFKDEKNLILMKSTTFLINQLKNLYKSEQNNFNGKINVSKKNNFNGKYTKLSIRTDQEINLRDVLNNSGSFHSYDTLTNLSIENNKISSGNYSSTEDSHSNHFKKKCGNEHEKNKIQTKFNYILTCPNNINVKKKQTKVTFKKVYSQKINPLYSNYSNKTIKNQKNLLLSKIKKQLNMKKTKTEKNKINLTNSFINKNIIKKAKNPINIHKTPKNIISSDMILSENFNIFDYDALVGKSNTLPSIALYIYNKYNFNILNIGLDKYKNFCKKITEGYNRKNPYHSDLHAADITHTCFIYFEIGKINTICKLDKISICALILSCICHDYKHPGLNNNFLKETNNPLAEKYNDISILENMHISETFKLINNDKECNIFQNLDINIYKRFRKEMITCVLNTDIIYHKKHLDFMEKIINKTETNINYQDYMNLIIHSVDISNATKKFDIYIKWAKNITEEFCEQGDKEKKLGLPMICDRENINIYENQIGFIKNVVESFVTKEVLIFPNLKFLMDNLQENKNKLKKLKKNKN